MFEFARKSAKTVLVAAGAAGFVAFGAGAAVAAPHMLAPAVAPVGGAVNDALQGRLPETPELAVAQPAPDTRNVAAPSGDVSHVGPAMQEGLVAIDDTVADVRAASGTGPRTAQASPSGDPLPEMGPAAGQALRDAGWFIADTIVVHEQDDPREMLSSGESGFAEDIAGAPGGIVDDTLPATSAELEKTAEEPPVSVDDDAVSQVTGKLAEPAAAAGGAGTELTEAPADAKLPSAPLDVLGAPAELLPVSEDTTADLPAVPTEGVSAPLTASAPAGGPVDAPITGDLTEGVSVGPESAPLL